MFFIFRLFFLMVVVFFLLTLFTGVSLATRLRRNLRDPFLNPHRPDAPPPPPGKGEIVEGEFTVLEEKNK